MKRHRTINAEPANPPFTSRLTYPVPEDVAAAEADTETEAEDPEGLEDLAVEEPEEPDTAEEGEVEVDEQFVNGQNWAKEVNDPEERYWDGVVYSM